MTTNNVGVPTFIAVARVITQELPHPTVELHDRLPPWRAPSQQAPVLDGRFHRPLGSPHLPTAPPGVLILLIKGYPVKPLLLYLLLLLPLMFLLMLGGKRRDRSRMTSYSCPSCSLLFLHILLLPVLLLLNTGSTSLHASPAPVPTNSFLRPHGPPSLPQNLQFFAHFWALS